MSKFVTVVVAASLSMTPVLPFGLNEARAQVRFPDHVGRGIQCPDGTVFGWNNDIAVCIELGPGGDPGGVPALREAGGGAQAPKSPEDVKKELEEERKKRCDAAKAKDIANSDKMFDVDLQKCKDDSASALGLTFMGYGITLPAWVFGTDRYTTCQQQANDRRKKREFDAGRSDPSCG